VFDEASGRLIGQPADSEARIDRDPALWASMWGWTFGQPMPVVLGDGLVGICFFGQLEDRVPAVHFVRLALDEADERA